MMRGGHGILLMLTLIGACADEISGLAGDASMFGGGGDAGRDVDATSPPQRCGEDDDCVVEQWCSSRGECLDRRVGLCNRDRNCPVQSPCQWRYHQEISDYVQECW